MKYGFDENKHKVELPDIRPIGLNHMPSSSGVNNIDIPYPSDFTRSNTIVVGIGIYVSEDGAWEWGNNSYNISISAENNKMVLHYNAPVAQVAYSFNVVLMRALTS